MDLELCKDLIGLPYQEYGLGNPGYDCFTLAQEIYRRHGIILPDFDYSFGYSSQNNAVDENRQYYEKLRFPEPLSIAAIKYHPKYVTHIGVVIDHHRIIHATEKNGVVISRYTSPVLKNKIEGFYKWKAKTIN